MDYSTYDTDKNTSHSYMEVYEKIFGIFIYEDYFFGVFVLYENCAKNTKRFY